MRERRQIRISKTFLRCCTVAGLLLCALLVYYGWRNHLFTSLDALQTYMEQFGAGSAIIFIAFQAVQVVLPVLPGNVGCVGGVLMFGPFLGFCYNYIGIVLGSCAAFALSKFYGRPLMAQLFQEKTIEKYERWMGKHYTKLFAFAIVLPVAPDDLLCWLAGTTEMRWRTFLLIVLLGKPLALVMYSVGMTWLTDWLDQILVYVPAWIG